MLMDRKVQRRKAWRVRIARIMWNVELGLVVAAFIFFGPTLMHWPYVEFLAVAILVVMVSTFVAADPLS